MLTAELVPQSRMLVMRLSTRTVGVSHTAEYHFYEDFRGHVTTTPSGVEIFGRCSRDHFVHCFSCCDEILNALPKLHQHVTAILQICGGCYQTMARASVG